MRLVLSIGRWMVTRAVWCTCALVLVWAGAALCSAQASAAVGGDPNLAQLQVAGPDTIQVALHGVTVNGKQREGGDVHPVVLNTGTASTKLNFSAFLDASTGACASTPIRLTSSAGLITLRAGATAAPILHMILGTGCIGDDGTIVISAGPGVAPVTLRFTLARNIDEVNYWLPIVISGVLALIFVLAVGWIRREVLGKTVLTGPSWSFTDSWLTNISTVGAILGTVLAATGFLSEVLPGISTGGFAGLSVLFGGFVIVAPVIYSAASKWQLSEPSDGGSSPPTLVSPGRVWGVVLAAGATLWGVFGELAVLVALTTAANASLAARAFIIGVLSAAAVITGWYAYSFVIGVSTEDKVDQPVHYMGATSGTL
jgi:hypothetical protein